MGLIDRFGLAGLWLAAVLLIPGCSPSSRDTGAADPAKTTDALGFSPATETTRQFQASVRSALPLDDPEDFEQSRRGFLGTVPELDIRDAKGGTVWNPLAYDFLTGEAPDTVNPSLWRQARINNQHGLFQLADRIYQVRGFDLANMTVIAGDRGWIIVDPLTTVETAQAALAFVNQTLGERPVTGLLFTHSHIDHFGGALGIVSAEAVHAEGIPVLAPAGFLEEATSENVLVGAAMGRRAMYMYGRQLPRSARGHIDSGLGKEPAFGRFSILRPTEVIERTGSRRTIDGIEFEFQIVSGSEAPSEFTFYLPQFRAWCGAELVSRTQHNLYTLRGAKVRDALLWSGYIQEALTLAEQSDLFFGSHHWPIWGRERIIAFLKGQRDTYRYIHDQTVRLINAGYTPSEIADTLELPPSLAGQFANRGYYGTVRHNARAVYQAYLGWYDGNPAHLDPLPAEASAPRYVALMGGADAVLQQARIAFDRGDYRWVAELLNHLVFADPGHAAARALLANTYDQLGYQAESAPWRDVYLSGAYELRHGAPEQGVDITLMKDVLMQAPVENFLTSLAASLVGPRAFDAEYTINLTITDRQETHVLWIENAVLHHRRGEPSASADASLKITHSLFIRMLLGEAGLRETLFSDDLEVEGSRLDLVAFFSLFDKPKGVFNIVEP